MKTNLFYPSLFAFLAFSYANFCTFEIEMRKLDIDERRDPPPSIFVTPPFSVPGIPAMPKHLLTPEEQPQPPTI